MQDGGEAFARRVEDACLTAWPAVRHAFYDGWLLRFAGGHTRRANSVNALRRGAHDLGDKIRYCETAYRRQALPAIFRVFSFTEPELDGALDAAGYGPAEDETRVIHMDTAKLGGIEASAEVVIESAPSDAWFAAQAKCGGLDALAQAEQRSILGALAVPAFFAAARAPNGRLASLACGAVHDAVTCINLVVTDPAWRRCGLSRRAVSTVLAHARDRAGATGACLAVVAANTPAIALYRRLGFRTELYRYHYRRRLPYRSALWMR